MKVFALAYETQGGEHGDFIYYAHREHADAHCEKNNQRVETSKVLGVKRWYVRPLHVKEEL